MGHRRSAIVNQGGDQRVGIGLVTHRDQVSRPIVGDVVPQGGEYPDPDVDSAGDRLARADIDESDLASILAQALATSELQGRVDVLDETV